ncbi:hypothetical protein CLOP_g4727 [Closterium sp. NIES-67]|nr:hypothetical protein CLOP_g4727 [Closterium sp. NIES-67]
MPQHTLRHHPRVSRRLTQLKFLELNNNQLSGEIPATVGNLKRLKSISLAHNQLQGRVPRDLTTSARVTPSIISPRMGMASAGRL